MGRVSSCWGNKNAIAYKEIFPLLRDDKLWLGFTSPSDFTVPGKGTTKKVNGLCRWYTNLDTSKRHEDLLLYRRYKGHEAKYPRYDNYDAIEVSKVADIPEDWFSVMGVPITLLDSHNPAQFEILEITDRNNPYGLTTKVYTKGRWSELQRLQQAWCRKAIRRDAEVDLRPHPDPPPRLMQ